MCTRVHTAGVTRVYRMEGIPGYIYPSTKEATSFVPRGCHRVPYRSARSFFGALGLFQNGRAARARPYRTRCLNPLRTAVSFRGQTSLITSVLSPKRDCSSKRVVTFLLRGTIVNRAYGTHKNLHIYLFLYSQYVYLFSMVPCNRTAVQPF